jgi:hypothetical protein
MVAAKVGQHKRERVAEREREKNWWLLWAWRGVCFVLFLLHWAVALSLGQIFHIWSQSKCFWLNVALMLEPFAVALALLATVGVAMFGWGAGMAQPQLVVATVLAVVTVFRGTFKLFSDLEDKAGIVLFGHACRHAS